MPLSFELNNCVIILGHNYSLMLTYSKNRKYKRSKGYVDIMVMGLDLSVAKSYCYLGHNLSASHVNTIMVAAELFKYQ